MTIEFQWDSRDLEVWRGRKVDKALARALRLAGNAALKDMQQESTERVKRKKVIREADVLKGLPTDKPRTSVAIKDLQWVMRVSGNPTSLGKFPNVQTRTGVTARINASGKTQIKSAFQARLSTGHEGVFRRTGDARYPIKKLVASSIADVMQNVGLIPIVYVKAMTRFQQVFDKGMKREMLKLRKSGDI